MRPAAPQCRPKVYVRCVLYVVDEGGGQLRMQLPSVVDSPQLGAGLGKVPPHLDPHQACPWEERRAAPSDSD